MTTIEQLQISGIRSFDPKPANRQTVYFQKPLTVILGKNGAGKTTIIEALLNACTGGMPPGSGTEKSSFVYDPKVIGENEVKGQIRLIFTGKGGKMMQVIRSFQASRQRNKTTFNTLDNTVAFLDQETGKVISNTYRASDVDRVVPEMLGVSPAVLEHVIFCHQEHCNWPLAAPRDVKQIFDDIFAATRYVSALERLRDNSKEYRRQQKEHESSLFALREYRDQANQLQEDINRKEETIESIRTRNKDIEPELKQLREASASLQSIRQNTESLEREIALISSRIEDQKEKIKSYGLPKPENSLKEMQEIKKNFSLTITEAENAFKKNSEELNKTQNTILRQREEELKLRSELHFLENEASEYKSNCEDLKGMIPDNEELTLGENTVDERSLNRAIQNYKQETEKMEEEIKAKEQGSLDGVNAIEKRARTIQRELDREEKEKDLIQSQLNSQREKVKEYNQKKTELGGGEINSEMDQVQKEIAQIEENIKAADELRKKGEHFQRRENIMKEMDELNAKVSMLRQVLHQKKVTSEGVSQLNSERQNLEERERQMQSIVEGELAPLLSEIEVEVPVPFSISTVSSKIEALIDKKKMLLQQIQEEISSLGLKLVVEERQRDQGINETTIGEMELSRRRKEVDEVLPGGVGALANYESEVQKAREHYELCCEKIYTHGALGSCYKEFMEAAEQDNVCSVCERPFANHKELEEFKLKTQHKLDDSPQTLSALQAASKEASEKLKKLEKLENDITFIRDWEHKLAELKKSSHELTESCERFKSQSTDAISRKEGVMEQLESMQRVARVVFSISMQQKEIQKKKSDVSVMEKRVADVMNAIQKNSSNKDKDKDDIYANKTYDDVLEEFEEDNRRLLSLHQQLNEARRQEEGGTGLDLETALSKKKEIRYALELKATNLNNLETLLSSCNAEIEGHKKRLKEIEAHKSELDKELKEIQNTIKTQRAEVDTEISSLRATLQQKYSTRHRIEELGSKILGYGKAGKWARMEKVRKDIAEVARAIQEGEAQIKSLNKEIAAARKTIDEQHRHGAKIDEQIAVLELMRSCDAEESRLKETERALAELKRGKVKGIEKILGPDIQNASHSELQNLIAAKLSDLEKVRAQQEGNVEAMIQDLTSLKAQLARDKYANIEKRYRSTYLKVQTAEIAVKDVDKYYVALEKAVQSYHQEKISQINRIIAELWGLTYRGSDIDTVEIHSETESTTAASARRSYSYCVVMKRDGREIDMRGRCSAGQKVLASVIIRLALSEAFCSECGILALDEPTTNLDEDNARSLAEALRALIETRRTVVKHFQLIVITHDEQFVRALGGQSLERFFYVHKDREGAFSMIEERTFDQLFAA